MRRRIGGGQAAAAFAREIGVGEQLLGQWVHAECAGTGGVAEVPLDLDERTELERLRREIQELCMDNEFLGTADSAGRRNTSIWRYAMVRRQRAAESFRSVFKNECYHRHMLATIDAARCGTHTWIVGWYKARRRHSGIGSSAH